MVLDKSLEYKFLVDNPDFPYCSGCGHTWINKSLDSALQKLGKSPREINLVTDIGCVGLVDKLFLTNTIHTTHGRSTAFATGLQLADSILYGKDSKHIIMIGDGGATIGLLHLVEAAKMNADITVILHNNFVYGMTGGQHSGLTPESFKTSTTMDGNIVPPLQLLEMMKASHAGFLSRKLATDKDLDDAILEAINYPGFAVLEVIELCTGYATKWNKMSKDDVHNILVGMQSDDMGVIVNDAKRKAYSDLYSQNFPKKKVEHKVKTIEVKNELKIKPFSVVVAGSAGEGVQFASGMFLQAGVSNGLNVMQKNDNPVTIGTGFSMSELNFSSETLYYSGIEVPDFLVITSEDGYNRALPFIAAADSHTVMVMDDSLPEPKTKAKVIRHPYRKLCPNKKVCNIMAIGTLFQYIEGMSVDCMANAISAGGKNVENTVTALRQGYDLK